MKSLDVPMPTKKMSKMRMSPRSRDSLVAMVSVINLIGIFIVVFRLPYDCPVPSKAVSLVPSPLPLHNTAAKSQLDQDILPNTAAKSQLDHDFSRTLDAGYIEHHNTESKDPDSHIGSELSYRPKWNESFAPSFCKGLIANPQASIACSKDQVTAQCADGVPRFTSGDYQDYYIYTRHFAKLKRRGTYIDIAANEPAKGSNTFIMDVCLGWDGICVEANPKFHDLLRIVRNCHLVPTCASDKEGEKVSFALAGGVGGILATNKHAANWKKMNIHRPVLNLTCIPMFSLQKKQNLRHVDFLSLDVEGHELNVLKGFNWDDISINVITVEISTSTLPSIEEFLTSKGFTRHMVDMVEYDHRPNHKNTPGTLFQDAIFVHNTVTFGSPV